MIRAQQSFQLPATKARLHGSNIYHDTKS
jgi:hypothetical protein